MSGRGLVIARRPWRLAASGGLPWAGLQLRLMTLGSISALIDLQLIGQVGRKPRSVLMQLYGQMSAIAQYEPAIAVIAFLAKRVIVT